MEECPHIAAMSYYRRCPDDPKAIELCIAIDQKLIIIPQSTRKCMHDLKMLVGLMPNEWSMEQDYWRHVHGIDE